MDVIDYLKQHPLIASFVVSISMMLLGIADFYMTGLPYFSEWNWFVGGELFVCTIAADIIEKAVFLGLFRWPAALIVVMFGTRAVWKARPANWIS